MVLLRLIVQPFYVNCSILNLSDRPGLLVVGLSHFSNSCKYLMIVKEVLEQSVRLIALMCVLVPMDLIDSNPPSRLQIIQFLINCNHLT